MTLKELDELYYTDVTLAIALHAPEVKAEELPNYGESYLLAVIVRQNWMLLENTGLTFPEWRHEQLQKVRRKP